MTSTHRTPLQHDWVNTFVGILDSAFYLNIEEQFAVMSIVKRLFQYLNIPQRGEPTTLPMPLVQEMYAGFYTTQLQSVMAGYPRPIREHTSYDCVTSIETWSKALSDMVEDAYPDLTPDERIMLNKVLVDVLVQLGVPKRAPASVPDAVMRVYREIEDNSPELLNPT